MPTGMSLPSFTCAASRGICGPSQANIQNGAAARKVSSRAAHSRRRRTEHLMRERIFMNHARVRPLVVAAFLLCALVVGERRASACDCVGVPPRNTFEVRTWYIPDASSLFAPTPNGSPGRRSSSDSTVRSKAELAVNGLCWSHHQRRALIAADSISLSVRSIWSSRLAATARPDYQAHTVSTGAQVRSRLKLTTANSDCVRPCK
jgi:hypothetical protein